MSWWEADSFTINVGSVSSGAITDTYTDDGNRHVLNETTGSPGFDYEYWFAGVPSLTSFRFVVNGYYDGNPAHYANAYAWNYTLSIWQYLGQMPDETADQTYNFPSLGADFISGGQAKIRFTHPVSGAVGHYLRLDMINIENLGADVTTAAPTSVPPTSLAPTTLAPTTLLSSTAPPTTTLTTPAPTTPPPHNHDNDTWFNCWSNNYAGVLAVDVSVDGYSLNASYGMETLELAVEVTISGGVPTSGLYVADDDLVIVTSISGWGVANEEKKNWVGWSKIGDVSFELDLTNDAGFRPMSWGGYLYQTLPLSKEVIIYGSGGVTRAYPVSSPAPTFGFKDILKVGVKNKTAIAGDDQIHFFVDILGCLWAITSSASAVEPEPKLQRIGYEEYLRDMTNPVLLWDAAKRRLYISDANTGFIYNDSALTGGHAGLTGLYRIASNLTAVGPETLIANPVHICTDIIDFERRGLKSIESVQTDIITDVPVLGAIDYRYKKSEPFRTTPWSPVNNEGVLHRRTAGVEFRIRFKTLDYGTFDMTYMSIQFKFIDQRFTRDPKGPLKVI